MKRATVDGACVRFVARNRWKALTEEERNKYVEAAEQDKIRYETEIAEWNKPEAKQARAEKAAYRRALHEQKKAERRFTREEADATKKEAKKEERAEKDAQHAAQKAEAAAAHELAGQQ